MSDITDMFLNVGAHLWVLPMAGDENMKPAVKHELY